MEAQLAEFIEYADYTYLTSVLSMKQNNPMARFQY